jgi:hypothetical protein
MIDLMRDAGGQVEIINPSKILPEVLENMPRKKRTKPQKKKSTQEVE